MTQHGDSELTLVWQKKSDVVSAVADEVSSKMAASLSRSTSSTSSPTMALIAGTLKEFTKSSQQLAMTQAMAHAPGEQKAKYFATISANAIVAAEIEAEELALRREELRLKRLQVQQQIAAANSTINDSPMENAGTDPGKSNEIDLVETSTEESSEKDEIESPRKSSDDGVCSFRDHCRCASDPVKKCDVCGFYTYHDECHAAYEDVLKEKFEFRLEVGFGLPTCFHCQENNIRQAKQGKGDASNPYVFNHSVNV